MKHSITIITLFLFAISAHGQEKADQLFQIALSNYESGKYYQAGTVFQEIFENYKKFEYHDQCFYNTAYSYHQADSLDLAITWYEKIRASKLKDDDRVGGRGIFEPYANYKHNSTFNIASIEYNRANYEMALDYYRQSLEKYPYYNESGTDIRIRQNRLAIYITDCLEKLGRYEEALMIILPQAISSMGSSNYESVVNKAIDLIEVHFDKKEIKSEVDSALDTLKKHKKHYSFTITLRHEEVTLMPYWLDERTTDGLNKEIKESDFWTKLNEK